jgi:hypothetical protein
MQIVKTTGRAGALFVFGVILLSEYAIFFYHRFLRSALDLWSQPLALRYGEAGRG